MNVKVNEVGGRGQAGGGMIQGDVGRGMDPPGWNVEMLSLLAAVKAAPHSF